MNEEVREGFFRDHHGNWHPDRRSGGDRRADQPPNAFSHERRGLFRRQADREMFERDHKQMIDDALFEFAEEHNGHL